MKIERWEFPQVAACFQTGRQASRRVAGVAAAARAARGLIEDGAAEVYLVIDDGDTLDEAAWQDLRRVCGEVPVTILGPGEARFPCKPAPVATSWEILRATGKASDGLIARVLNRPISRCFSAVLLRVPGVRPVHATLGTAAMAIIMFLALVAGSAKGLLIGGISFHAASVFDGVDGEIARATYRESAAGASLDSAVDLMTNLLFVLGLTVNLSVHDGMLATVLGTWSMTLLALGFWLIARRNRRDEEPLRFEWLKQYVRRNAAGTRFARVGELATFATTRASIALFFMGMILAGLAMPALCLLALGATIWMGALLTALAASGAGAMRRVASGNAPPPDVGNRLV